LWLTEDEQEEGEGQVAARPHARCAVMRWEVLPR
jgi:hypothetical protein